MHEKSCIFFVYSNEGENYGKNFKTRLGFLCIIRQYQWTQYCLQRLKTPTATKNDSVTSSNSVKSNSTASKATDKAKSDDLVTHGQSNAGKAKTTETANRTVTGKTTVAKTNKQVATGNTKKSANKSTSSSQKAGNTTSANAGTTVKSSNADNGSSDATLPQTGNSKSTAGIIAGTALVATMATLGIAYSKKKRK